MKRPILHQPSHTTWRDRHPDIFARAAAIIGKGPAHLLSFGCSSGEECYTLREYIPHATVVGADISLPLIEQNRERNRDPAVTFVHSQFSNLKRYAPYDMIFAINVLVRDVISPFDYPLYVFDYFEEQLLEFDRLLRVGGHLVLVHTQHDARQSSLLVSGAYRDVATRQFLQKVSPLPQPRRTQ